MSRLHPVAEQLADLRRAAHLDRADIAAQAGVRAQHLKYWETGHYVPTAAGVKAWAAALGCALAVQPRAGIPLLGDPVEALASLRRRRGMTQLSVAGHAGFTQSQLSQWERGSHVPGLWTLSDWADLLGCDLTLVPAAVLAGAA
jgi:transcriptional regulator with XRE-family HTH domain